MLQLTTISQALPHLRALGQSTVRAVALIPVTLTVALLFPTLMSLAFTRRSYLLPEVLGCLSTWTDIVVNGGAAGAARRDVHPESEQRASE